MDQFLQAKVLKADLVSIDTQFTEKGMGDMPTMVLLKQSLISVANFVDFEVTIRRMYKDHPELNEFYKSFAKECEFAKYLRNKFVGHLKQELVNKALEWNPEIRMFLNKMDDPIIAYVVNQLILETAINTYVDNDQNHKVFDSETDLNYPPDSTRFLKFLTLIIRSSIEYLGKYIEIRQEDVQAEIDEATGLEGMLKLGIEAGKTDFSFIKK
ncbi:MULTISPECIES: hypothetical protein [Vibrio]|uniref:hypothetical protein n=1 Tax=Vibrio TaxID=662 RepID=UPI000C8659F9|nr:MULTISPECIES: hypothetical protein [Vibrio]MBE8558987.1 hypothetical protein [Vibrio sp. OPT24]PMH55781.1 hypothetical protein BCU65_14570 [Vibrio cyclitrophicus]PMK97283.1 hypothetical protein BCT87_08445 [Vibrio cyclitrophicus]